MSKRAVPRYCGDVKVLITFVDRDDQYECNIYFKNEKLGTISVGARRHGSVDSPQAYDETARAALGFAMDEEERGEKDWGGLSSRVAYDEGLTQLDIRRVPGRSRRHGRHSR